MIKVFRQALSLDEVRVVLSICLWNEQLPSLSSFRSATTIDVSYSVASGSVQTCITTCSHLALVALATLAVPRRKSGKRTTANCGSKVAIQVCPSSEPCPQSPFGI